MTSSGVRKISFITFTRFFKLSIEKNLRKTGLFFMKNPKESSFNSSFKEIDKLFIIFTPSSIFCVFSSFQIKYKYSRILVCNSELIFFLLIYALMTSKVFLFRKITEIIINRFSNTQIFFDPFDILYNVSN